MRNDRPNAYIPACEVCRFPVSEGTGGLFVRYEDINDLDAFVQWHPEHHTCAAPGSFGVDIDYPLSVSWFDGTATRLEFYEWFSRTNWREMADALAYSALHWKWAER